MTISDNTAPAVLILLDCQEGVAARALVEPAARAAFTTTVSSLIASAQSLALPCIRVEVEFRGRLADQDTRILGIATELKPWRMAARRGAKQVLELRAGEAARTGLGPGRRLELEQE